MKFLQPFAVTIYITVFFASLTLPLPWEKQKLFYAGVSGIQPFNERVRFKSIGKYIDIFINSASSDFPIHLALYDFHIQFKGAIDSPLGDAAVLRVSFRKNTDFYHYAKNVWGAPNQKLSDDIVGTYEFNVGDKKEIKAIPAIIPIDYSSGAILCFPWKKNETCPEDLSFNTEKSIDAYASPNLWSWLAQFLVIFSFWALFFNTILNLVNRGWKN